MFNLNENQIHWSDPSSGYFDQFRWRSHSHNALALLAQGEQWQSVELNILTGYTQPLEYLNEAGIYLTLGNDEVSYMSRNNTKGIWRINHTQGESIKILSDEQITYHSSWSLTKQGLYFIKQSAHGIRLNYVEHNSNKVEEINADFPGVHISSPLHGKWLVTVDTSIGDTEIVELRSID